MEATPLLRWLKAPRRTVEDRRERPAMNDPHAVPPTELDLLLQTSRYLAHREHGLAPPHELERAWARFYDVYAHKIRAYAFVCGTAAEDLADCSQEVWRELIVRLPTFQLDPERGKFDTWLFNVVQSKTSDMRRRRKRHWLQGDAAALPGVADHRPGPGRAMEAQEFAALAWDELGKKLSACSLQVLQLRLVHQLSVAEVAQRLNLSQQQVWYRYHRARRELATIGIALANGEPAPIATNGSSREEKKNQEKPAQGNLLGSVSRSISPSFLARQGGPCVDYVFQRLELGRRELTPEWKVEWKCDETPRPVLYIRKMAMVAYAEICGPEELVTANWPRIVNAAIAAGVASGIATIIATPTAALPVFRAELQKHLNGKGPAGTDNQLQLALSAHREPNGPWMECKQTE
jgi:RNA polymerase sigma factor (sigma-70 family)